MHDVLRNQSSLFFTSGNFPTLYMHIDFSLSLIPSLHIWWIEIGHQHITFASKIISVDKNNRLPSPIQFFGLSPISLGGTI